MSQARLAYPLLDGYLLGEALSEHDGVRCYPAIRQKTGEKYIVKVISFPASRVQLDALLLSGAYTSKDEALRYYRDLARDVRKQAEILSQLSQQEGFTAYQGTQIIPAADENGYEVYLLGTFKTPLRRLWETDVMTHRGVLELGLDLCAALAACRRAGYLYIDLQPGNVYFAEDQGYRIGDVGFTPLSSLKFAALPKQYHSRYTAPEMADAFAEMNTTLDIYALGLILYQACNGGQLPDGELSAPLYADYELAEIIAKACDSDPAKRWQDPTQLAQALIGYMQRNEVTDAPLAPTPVTEETVNADTEDFLPEVTEEELAQAIAELPENEVVLMEAMAAQGDDIADTLAQAEELADPEIPEAVAVPIPAEAPAPEPAQEDMGDFVSTSPAPAAPVEIDCPIERRPFPWKWVLSVIAIVLLLFGGYHAKQFYDNIYIQSVESIVITQSDSTATVKIVSGIDESLLTVICSDSYGNVKRAAVTDGIAVFTDLNPQTHYTIRLEISGAHKLTGTTVDGFTTPARTQILSFTAGIGPEDASVMLTLATSGPAVESWTVTYWADGVDAAATTFRGSNVTLYDLVVGKSYTFSLSAAGQVLDGCTQVNYTASNIILPKDLTITACGGGNLTAQWKCPEDFTPVNGWAVRCYNSAGFDETVITYEPHYTFTGIDHSVPCSVEVRYVGMVQSVRTEIGANPITVENFEYTISSENGLTIRWNYSGTAPESGWDVLCVIDGNTSRVTTAEPFIVAKMLPGAVYQICVSAVDGTTVLGGNSSNTISEVAPFAGYGVNAETLSAQISGQTITLIAPAEAVVESSEHYVDALCLLRTSDGVLVKAFEDEFLWNTIWEGNVCTMLLPELPNTPGTYVLNIFFDGGWMAEVEFTVE